MRQVLGVVAGAVTAALGALIVGEYEFKGFAPVLMGALFGLAIAELMVWAGQPRAPWVAVAAALFSAGGLLWAGWISVNHRHQGLPGGAYVAAAIGAVVAGVRTRGGIVRHTTADTSDP